MNVARYIDTLVCPRCTWPVEACPCVLVPLDVQRAWHAVVARHRADVARARASRGRKAA